MASYDLVDRVRNYRAGLRQRDGENAVNVGISRREFILLAAALGAACGSPVAPDTNPPPPPSNNVTTQGPFVGLYSRQGYNSGIAQIGTLQGNISDGKWSVSNVPPGTAKLTLTGNAFLDRIVRIEAQPGGTNAFDTIDAIEKEFNGFIFDVNWFNRLARRSNGIYKREDGIARPLTWPDGTTRWVEKPTFYIDKQRLGAVIPDPTTYKFILEKIKYFINTIAPKGTYGFFSGADIKEVNTAELPKQGTRGAFVVYGQNGFGGVATNERWIDDFNQIFYAEVEFSGNVDTRAVNRDMSMATGLGADIAGSGNDSIFYVNSRAGDPEEQTASDLLYWQALYSMLPGTKSPYDTSHLITLKPISVQPLSIQQQSGYPNGVNGTADFPSLQQPNRVYPRQEHSTPQPLVPNYERNNDIRRPMQR